MLAWHSPMGKGRLFLQVQYVGIGVQALRKTQGRENHIEKEIRKGAARNL
jgi:hypothetical protein